jgi:hypothetical protein
MSPRSASLVALVLLLASGCAVPRRSYLLVGRNGAGILIPPGVRKADLLQRTFTSKAAAGPGTCSGGGDAVQAVRRGQWLRVTVRRDALTARPRGWLWLWTAEAEAQGCVGPGAGLRLAAAIAEALPLKPAEAYRLLHAGDVRYGYVDLGPENRLQTFTPIMREGAAPDAPILETVSASGSGATIDLAVRSTPNLLGVETAWFALIPKAPAPGFTIRPLSAERNIQGKVERSDVPLADYLRFPATAAYFRLFYKADMNGVAVTEMVIAGATRAELDRQTKDVDARPELCEEPGALCAVIPPRAAVNPFLVVTVNGAEIALPTGASVASAIQAGGEKDPKRTLSTLAIFRLYGGKPTPVEFDRSDPEILRMPLGGGERISW